MRWIYKRLYVIIYYYIIKRSKMRYIVGYILLITKKAGLPLLLFFIILAAPVSSGAGTFTENFLNDEKKAAETTANWDKGNGRLLLSTSILRPLENEIYNTTYDDDYEIGYRFRALYDGKITALG